MSQSWILAINMKKLVVFMLTSLSLAAGAQTLPDDAKIGTEFTITNEALAKAPLIDQRTGPEADDISTVEGQKKLVELMDEVRRRCSSCEINLRKNRYDLDEYRVSIGDKFTIIYSLDQHVIEINTTAMTTTQLLEAEAVLENLIFKAGKAVGIEANIEYGGGHVHWDLATSIGSDPVLFRNFFADLVIHSDVFKVLGSGPNNSPVPIELPQSQQKALIETIASIDQELIERGFTQGLGTEEERRKMIERIAQRIQTEVYFQTPSGKLPSAKYQAFNLSRVADPTIPWEEKTYEIRVFRAQRSVREVVSIADMVKGRIRLVKKSSGLIQVVLPSFRGETNKHLGKRVMTYIQGSGVPFEQLEHAVYLKNVLTKPSSVACRLIFQPKAAH